MRRYPGHLQGKSKDKGPQPLIPCWCQVQSPAGAGKIWAAYGNRGIHSAGPAAVSTSRPGLLSQEGSCHALWVLHRTGYFSPGLRSQLALVGGAQLWPGSGTITRSACLCPDAAMLLWPGEHNQALQASRRLGIVLNSELFGGLSNGIGAP